MSGRRGALDDEWDLPASDLEPPPAAGPEATILQFRYRLADALRPTTTRLGSRTRAGEVSLTPPTRGSHRP